MSFKRSVPDCRQEWEVLKIPVVFIKITQVNYIMEQCKMPGFRQNFENFSPPREAPRGGVFRGIYLKFYFF